LQTQLLSAPIFEFYKADYLMNIDFILKVLHTLAQKNIDPTMKISKDKVAAIHYTLKDNSGTTLDSSSGREPLYYLHGAGNLILGMEEGLEGKIKGDKFLLKVSPEKGYGVKDSNLTQKVPRSAFGDQKVEKGMKFQTNQGGTVTVVETSMDSVTVDANHPLAGVELNFDVEIMDVREATQDELTHGHVHGPGGHHH
jgi:FKBP-type peptidyl-prolyl cis-trans isomerase SlyD